VVVFTNQTLVTKTSGRSNEPFIQGVRRTTRCTTTLTCHQMEAVQLLHIRHRHDMSVTYYC